VSAALAIASGAAVQSSIASQKAHQAKVISCQSFVHGYKHDTATQQEMKQYSECVHILIPSEPLPDGVLMIFKLCVVILLVAFFVGTVRAARYEEGILDRVLNGALYSIMALVFGLIVGIVSASIWFIFS
jgi:hypothetical protein